MNLLDMYITIMRTPDMETVRVRLVRTDNPPVRNAVTSSRGFLSSKMKEL